MDEERAKEVLGDIVQVDGSLLSSHYGISWALNDNSVLLNGWFSATELECLVWWMRNKWNEKERADATV